MAKHHKFMWNGVDIETSAQPEQIWAAVDTAITQAKGKYTKSSDTDLLKSWDIRGSNTLFATSAELSFEVQISDETSGRRAVRTHILRALLKDGSIPFGAKTMLGQKAFMAVSQSLAALLTHIDPTTKASFREGPMPDGFALGSLASRVTAPVVGS
jgi:hypothetical protein